MPRAPDSAKRKTRPRVSGPGFARVRPQAFAAGLPAGPVQRIDQALTSAHSVHRGDVIEKDWYKGVASPIRLERTKPTLRHTPPKFSEHAAEVLGEFGYSIGEIDALVAKGVVCGPEKKH